MEHRFENINKIMAHKVSHLQHLVNHFGKEQVIDSFRYQLWQVWMVPLFLTYGELICLKHDRLRAANSVALFKWASVPLAVALSWHYYGNLQHKINYYDSLYPHAPQTQDELHRDKFIAQERQK